MIERAETLKLVKGVETNAMVGKKRWWASHEPVFRPEIITKRP